MIYNSNTNSILWERTYTDYNKGAYFVSVTSNPFYCVYVADRWQSKVWVFTQGLTELLYTYGENGTGVGQFCETRDICIYKDEVAITEMWTDKTGIQYFKIVPEIRDFYATPNPFDATEESTQIHFKVCETAGYLTLKAAGKTLFENKYYKPGSYSIWWDGRDGRDSVVLPGTALLEIYAWSGPVASAAVGVKGTKKSGILQPDEHWTEAGEPYVLVGDVFLPDNGRLTIDPGVKVMPRGNFRIAPWTSSYSASLIARGNPLNKILFTPHRKLLPVPDPVDRGFWKGIRFASQYDPSDSLILEHCLIEAAGSDSAAIYSSDYGLRCLRPISKENKREGRTGWPL